MGSVKRKNKSYERTGRCNQPVCHTYSRSLHVPGRIAGYDRNETPPPERYPITTYVLEYNDDIIRDAIQTEIDRGG